MALSTNPSGLDRRAELSGPRHIDRPAVWVETSQAAWPIEDGELPIRVLMHPHGRLDIVVTMALRRDLQGEAFPDHAIVAADPGLRRGRLWRLSWTHRMSSSGRPA